MQLNCIHDQDNNVFTFYAEHTHAVDKEVPPLFIGTVADFVNNHPVLYKQWRDLMIQIFKQELLRQYPDAEVIVGQPNEMN